MVKGMVGKGSHEVHARDSKRHHQRNSEYPYTSDTWLSEFSAKVEVKCCIQCPHCNHYGQTNKNEIIGVYHRIIVSPHTDPGYCSSCTRKENIHRYSVPRCGPLQTFLPCCSRLNADRDAHPDHLTSGLCMK